ncbi:isopentenyl-diphosphate Delta-isomerase [Planosporangium sp. 12N6]|uniref:isopentenyl-diphosphate Delta-isomerase n=1 Tax=Planosporangium spinosum TaxID=3402278 RepID=UPI003CFBC190
MSREETLVELVDAAGVAIGSATVAAAHTAPGQLHRAFSVLLVDPAGRLLLQQRAEAKTRFPLRWANACCGHPAPGEDLVTAATRRLGEELGLESIALKPVGVYVYRALDPVTERVEHEYDHVLVGEVRDEQPRPDPAEVAAVRWACPYDVRRAVTAQPWSYAPWLAGVVAVWDAAVSEPNG